MKAIDRCLWKGCVKGLHEGLQVRTAWKIYKWKSDINVKKKCQFVLSFLGWKSTSFDFSFFFYQFSKKSYSILNGDHILYLNALVKFSNFFISGVSLEKLINWKRLLIQISKKKFKLSTVMEVFCPFED